MGKDSLNLRKQMQELDRDYMVMVFCRSVEDAAACAEHCRVQPYTGSTDLQECVSIMSNWLSGKHRVMVSTSILGCGLDVMNM